MLVWFTLLFFPMAFLLGKAALELLYGREAKGEFAWEDAILTGFLLTIGLAEGAHVGALMHGQSVSAALKYFGILFLGCLLVGGLFYGIRVLHWRKNKTNLVVAPKAERQKRNERILLAGIGIVLVSQLLAILFRTAVYLDADLTLETVVTFVKEDRLFGSNPLTGRPYTQGVPTRIKLLCLPTLYGMFCKGTGALPETVVYKVVPAVVLIMAYLAYASVGRTLFSEKKWQADLFLLLAGILFWVEDSMYGLEGFGLLHAGFQGTAIRGGVLLPYLFGLCLRRKWKLAAGVILAEACIVWTLYGAGMGLAMCLAFGVIRLFRKRFFDGKEDSR